MVEMNIEQQRALAIARARQSASMGGSPPEPAPKKSNVFTGLVGSVTQGITFGAGDEISAAVDALIGQGPGGMLDVGNYERPFGERYSASLDDTRARQKQFSDEYGTLDFIGEAAGGIGSAALTLGTGAVAQGATRLAQMGRAAITGAGGGALYGFADGEGSANRAIGAGVGAITGAAGGVIGREAAIAAQRVWRAVLGRPALYQNGALTDAGRRALNDAGIDPATISDEFAQAFAARVKQAGGATDEVARMAQADEFGIPLTRGQATGDVTQSAYEEASRNAARGGSALQSVHAIDSAATDATRRASEGLGRGLGGAEGTALDLAGQTGEAVQAAARAAREGVNAAYQNPLIGSTSVSVDAFEGLGARVDDALTRASFAPTSAATGAVADIRRLVEKAQAGPDGAIGVSFEAIEDMRQKLNRVKGDGAALYELKEIKRAFDDWTQDTVDSALISGSDEALEAVKIARRKYSAFRKTFTAQPGDDASRLIEKMVKDDVTPQEVANVLWGATKVGTKGSSVRVATRLKAALPEADFNNIRSGTWARVAQTDQGATLTPAKMRTRINDFLDGEGEALSKVMFSAEERMTMRRFSRAMDILIPPREATNPSGSGYAISRLMQDTWQAAMTSLGMVTGGPAGAIGARIAAASAGGAKASLKAAGIAAPLPLRGPGAVSNSALTAGVTGAGGAQASNALNESFNAYPEYPPLRLNITEGAASD
jgi:hypothetical protein